MVTLVALPAAQAAGIPYPMTITLIKDGVTGTLTVLRNPVDNCTEDRHGGGATTSWIDVYCTPGGPRPSVGWECGGMSMSVGANAPLLQLTGGGVFGWTNCNIGDELEIHTLAPGTGWVGSPNTGMEFRFKCAAVFYGGAWGTVTCHEAG
ncbi:MAG: hypothetical protein LC623_07835 [Halobacteriales archaeon]|nr:hypothetical protein [Halobacteriales archaeon]